MRKSVGIAVFAFIVLASLAFCAEAAEVQLGFSNGIAHSKGGVETVIGLQTPRWFTRYHRLGGDWSTTNMITAGRRVQWKAFYTEIGLALTDDTVVAKRELVSSKLTFHLGLGAELTLSPITKLQVGVWHNSTAGRSAKNTGIDAAYLRYSWSF